jgi:CMP-N-acetylneuraminic acid synthetase
MKKKTGKRIPNAPHAMNGIDREGEPMNVLGVILARAGSNGLKNKHLLPLCGRPVIEYTFDHAYLSSQLTRVVVSTDCPGVKRMAEARRLQVIDRPGYLSTGDASVQDAALHAMERLESNDDYKVDALVVLYGNVPVRGKDVIDRAVELLISTQCDSVRSFCPVGKWHPSWMSRLKGDIVEPLDPHSIHRRQDLDPLFLHDGAVVAVSRASMERVRQDRHDPHAFFGIDRRGIQTEAGETIEIDEQRDLYWAEAVLRSRTTQTRVA